MKPTGTVTTEQAVEIARTVTDEHCNIAETNVRDWRRRGLFPGDAVGRGRDSRYSFEEVAFITALAMFSDHFGYLRKAREAAYDLARRVTEIAVHGDTYEARKPEKSFLVTFSGASPEFHEISDLNTAAAAYGARHGVFVCPGIVARKLVGAWPEAGTVAASE